jgi:hypothetical protein
MSRVLLRPTKEQAYKVKTSYRSQSQRKVRPTMMSDDESSTQSASMKGSSTSNGREPSPDLENPNDFENFANNQKTLPTQPILTSGSESEEEQEQPPFRNSREDRPSEGFKSVEDEKRDILQKFKRLRENNVNATSKEYNIHSSIDDLRSEYGVVRQSLEVDSSVKFQRKVLIAISSGMEYLNTRFDPFNVELNGWSETIMESIGDYDAIFEKLHEKYRGTATMPPECELLLAIAGSAFTFHLSNSFFKKSMASTATAPMGGGNPSTTNMQQVLNEIKQATNQPTSQYVPPTFGVPSQNFVPMYPQPSMPPPPPTQQTKVPTQQTVPPTATTDSECSEVSDTESEKSLQPNKTIQIVETPKGRGRGRPRGPSAKTSASAKKKSNLQRELIL